MDLKMHALKVLAPQLEDPGNPQCCPLCLPQYSAMLLHPSGEPALTALLDCAHSFFDSCAKVLATPRTRDDLPPLRRMLARNVLRCGTKIWHGYLPSRSPDVLAQFVSALYAFMQAPFLRGRRPMKPGVTFSKSRRGVWPSSLTDLLPFGIEASFAAHVFWWDTLITCDAYPFLVMILDIARPSILPLFLADQHRAKLMDSLLIALTSSLPKSPTARGEADPISAWTPRERRNGPPFAAEFIHKLLVGHDCQIGDSRGFYVGYESVLFEAVSAIFHDAETRSHLLEHHASILTSLALTIHLELCLPESALHPDFIAARERHGITRPGAIEQEFATGARMTQMLVLTRRTVRACARLGCSAVAAATSPEEYGKLQTCARCKLFQYCGRECQQADWKGAGGGAPHKKLCPVLCKLAEGGALDAHRPYAEYAQVYNRIDITMEDVGLLVSWARTSKLVDEAMISGYLSLPFGMEGTSWPRPAHWL